MHAPLLRLIILLDAHRQILQSVDQTEHQDPHSSPGIVSWDRRNFPTIRLEIEITWEQHITQGLCLWRVERGLYL